MARAKSPRVRESVPGSAALNVLPVRPPAVPTREKHLVNLDACGLSAAALGEWLGLDAADVVAGDSAAVRVAVAFYCEWRARVLLARVK